MTIFNVEIHLDDKRMKEILTEFLNIANEKIDNIEFSPSEYGGYVFKYQHEPVGTHPDCVPAKREGY